MKVPVLYIGLQAGYPDRGFPDFHLVDDPSGSSKKFDPKKHVIIGLDARAKSRGIKIPPQLWVMLLAIFFVGASTSAAEEVCQYVWHDHYKTNYRKRHKHEVCGSVAEHYQDDPFRSMQLYLPDLYIKEVPEDEGDTETPKN